MLVLQTIAHDTIWGGQRLVPYGNKMMPRIGHLYSLQSDKNHSNSILNGEYAGRNFHEYFNENKNRFGLGEYREFPLIIALVEAKENLSIQVHPDDRVAAEEEGAAYGKNESWFFLKAPDSGYIYGGCLEDNLREVERRLREDDILSITGRVPVKDGDYVYVAGGTLHALTSGSYLYEIEENSPWTYRLYDYDRRDDEGRRRELHVNKGLKAIKAGMSPRISALGQEWKKERRYSVRRLEELKEYRNESDTLECLTMIEGELVADGLRAVTGTTVVLEPGEKAEGNIILAIAARPECIRQLTDEKRKKSWQ